MSNYFVTCMELSVSILVTFGAELLGEHAVYICFMVAFIIQVLSAVLQQTTGIVLSILQCRE